VGIPEGTSNGDPIYLTIEHFEEVGKGLLVSILDIFEKNPNTEVAKTKYGNVQNIRNEIASNLSKLKDYEMIPNPRFRYSGLYGVATKTFYNDFLKEDGPKKNNYSFLKEALPYRTPNNEINGKDYQKGQSEVIRDSSPNRDFPEFLRENVPKRNSESPVPEKRASSMGVGQLSNKNSKPNEPQLRTKIGELLASMNLERNKTLIGYGDLGNKHLKLVRKVIISSKLILF